MRLALAFLMLALVLGGSAAAQNRAVNTAANPIDLNSASRDALMTLEGIGEVKADAIIRARPFRAKTELVERRIVPEALYDKIADKVFARPPANMPTPSPSLVPSFASAGRAIASRSAISRLTFAATRSRSLSTRSSPTTTARASRSPAIPASIGPMR